MALACAALRVCAHEPEATQPFEFQREGATPRAHIHAGWESRYFSEGRDVLDGDAWWSSSAEFDWQPVAAGILYGRAPGQAYDELQLTVALTRSLRAFEWYVAYTRLEFPLADDSDNEVGAGLLWRGLPLALEFTTDIYHSFAAAGQFAEFALRRGFAIAPACVLSAAGTLGVNRGYVPDGHDGANHFALQLGVEYALTDALAVTAHAAYSWALARDATLAGDAGLVDFFHGKLGLEWSF
ncbi:MAG: hypothetical protein R3F42_10765 [Pseudomonadota bacterium]